MLKGSKEYGRFLDKTKTLDDVWSTVKDEKSFTGIIDLVFDVREYFKLVDEDPDKISNKKYMPQMSIFKEFEKL